MSELLLLTVELARYISIIAGKLQLLSLGRTIKYHIICIGAHQTILKVVLKIGNNEYDYKALIDLNIRVKPRTGFEILQTGQSRTILLQS